MPISSFCFAVAAAAGLGGMCLGIFMGMSQDFTLSPAHAHLNLLGWVTMALYGAWYRTADRAPQRLAWTQVAFGAAGFPLMAIGLGFYLSSGNDAIFPAIVVGSILCLLSMVMFLALVLIDARQTQRRRNTPVVRAELRDTGSIRI